MRIRTATVRGGTAAWRLRGKKGELDLDELPRVMCRVDRGAYERQFEEGDSDCDGDIDLRDFAMFSWCFTGADGGPVHEGCEAFDTDGDGDVEHDNVAEFLAGFAGPSE